MKTDEKTSMTLRPTGAQNRPETAPLLPRELVILPDGKAEARHPDLDGDILYPNFTEAARAYEASAVELLGSEFDDASIRGLRAEAGAHGDDEQVSECDAALAGDEEAREECASVVLAAMLEAVGP